MIFLDATAIVAILAEEPEGEDFTLRVDNAPAACTSSIAVYEASLALSRIGSITPSAALSIVSRFLARAAVSYVDIGPNERRMALEAFERFCKGDILPNSIMGDCLAYACARSNGARLLFKGDDFPQTDIEAA